MLLNVMVPHPPHVAAGMPPKPSSRSTDTADLMSLLVVVAVALALLLLVVMQRGPERAAAGVMPTHPASSVLSGVEADSASDRSQPGDGAWKQTSRVRDDLRPR